MTSKGKTRVYGTQCPLSPNCSTGHETMGRNIQSEECLNQLSALDPNTIYAMHKILRVTQVEG